MSQQEELPPMEPAAPAGDAAPAAAAGDMNAQAGAQPQAGEADLEYEFSEDEDEVDFLEEEAEEMELDDWDDDMPPDYDDSSDAGSEEEDEWLDEDDEDYLTPKQRVQLECGVLEHDAHFFIDDAPTKHPNVGSSTCHHQTADAITFLPRPAAAAGAGAGAGAGSAAGADVEEVLLSNKTALSIYQLAPGQPVRLLARSATCFRHYSIAASPCGNFVAASGNQGLVILFRVQRSANTQLAAKAGRAATGAAATGAAAPSGTAAGVGSVGDAAGRAGSVSSAGANAPFFSAAVGGNGDGGGGGGDAAAALPWQLVHEATLLCTNSRETMVNSVRFGNFGGSMRLLVSHQDGMLYLFNLPGSKQPPGSSSSSSASAAQPAAAGRGAAAAPAATGAAAPAAGAAAGAAAGTAARAPVAAAELMVRGLPGWEPLGSQINRSCVEQVMAMIDKHSNPEQQEQQEEQQQMDVDQSPDAQQAAAAAAAAAAAEAQQQRQQARAAAVAAARRSLRDDIASGRIVPEFIPVAEADEAARIRAAEEEFDAAGRPPAIAAPVGSLAHLEAALSSAERLLGFVVRHLAGSCRVRQAADQLLGWFDISSPQQQQHGQASWQQRAQYVGLWLQDEEFLKSLQKLQKMRLVFDDPGLDVSILMQVRSYTPSLEGLRKAAAAQRAMLGLLGPQRQQQQWEVQQQGPQAVGWGRERDMGVAVVRAGYVLLLLRLLAPSGVPAMQPSARVLVLRYGPSVDPAVRLQASDTRAAPRLTTCAISIIAPDPGAQQTAAVAAAAAAAVHELAQQPGEHPEAVAVAAVAAANAQEAAAAAEQQTLPLNICECSPDGRWLAVGVDQAAILLVPAGTGYQHHAAQVLDLCPALPPRHTRWQHQGTLGCQYVSFNSSSTLLAATCDYLKLVSVFEVASGQLLATFSLHNRPLLPVRFMPRSSSAVGSSSAAQQQQQGMVGHALGDESSLHDGGESSHWGDQLLVYCEDSGGLHIADLSTFKAAEGHGARPPTAGAPAAGIAAAAERHGNAVSDKFYLKSYIELPSVEPPAQAPQAQPAAAAPAPAAAAAAAGLPLVQQQAPQLLQNLQQQVEMQQQIQQMQQHMLQQQMQLMQQMQQMQQQQGQQLGQQQHQQEAEDFLDNAANAPAAAAAGGEPLRINGLAVTPAGRVLVACKSDLMEWQLLRGWSQTRHHTFPAAFKKAARLLLLAAASSSSTAAAAGSCQAAQEEAGSSSAAAAAETAAAVAGSSSASSAGSGSGGSAQLLSALPGVVLEQIIADAALPQGRWAVARTPTQQQLLDALNARPRPPEGPHAVVFPWGVQQMFMPGWA